MKAHEDPGSQRSIQTQIAMPVITVRSLSPEMLMLVKQIAEVGISLSVLKLIPVVQNLPGAHL